MEAFPVYCLMFIVYILTSAWHESGKDIEGGEKNED
ncbi:antirepressor [Bacillus phage vB_Bacillus_1020A]|jgi:hypothetical protein|nr:antirepressor [Bacillus phage vB_Bacillus_1020A]